ncbi:hypothetical protein D7W82_13475 [Corallococcus sp. CA049B]|nr:hypothetical protein D7W82_13475 [Corallococcus sp. CA049B]
MGVVNSTRRGATQSMLLRWVKMVSSLQVGSAKTQSWWRRFVTAHRPLMVEISSSEPLALMAMTPFPSNKSWKTLG